ncbi:hypothetical protein ACMDCR_29585 [Labrys okinawensis]|uniref:hypothetical protein n=1 Tax=Labrys okinawensis TaxID=346911 RepID=UPI0039BD89D9
MSAASGDQSSPLEGEERIYRALRKTIEAFFEGHDIAPDRREAFLKRLRKDLVLPAPKTFRSRVAFTSQRDINRMWAVHEKKQGKPKK